MATNTNDKIPYANKINLKIKRNPFSIKNFFAIFKLIKKLNNNNYDLIHTHTPVGSVVTRIAFAFSNSKAKLIYTCHGFHFYKGSPIYYWILFYPLEKLLMKKVDILILMNKEDYEFAKKHFKNVDIRFINGVGFNKNRLINSSKNLNHYYKELAISNDSFIVSYIAEYSKRKRQLELIKKLAKTDISKTNIKILLIGDDSLNGQVQKKIKKYGLEKSIKTIDFNDNINDYLTISNVVISVSRQEGLPLNIMEAIYKKKILIVTNCRGNIDLVKDNINGFVVNKIDEVYEKIIFIKDNYKELSKNYSQYIDIEKYSIDEILSEVTKIYKELL